MALPGGFAGDLQRNYRRLRSMKNKTYTKNGIATPNKNSKDISNITCRFILGLVKKATVHAVGR